MRPVASGYVRSSKFFHILHIFQHTPSNVEASNVQHPFNLEFHNFPSIPTNIIFRVSFSFVTFRRFRFGNQFGSTSSPASAATISVQSTASTATISTTSGPASAATIGYRVTGSTGSTGLAVVQSVTDSGSTRDSGQRQQRRFNEGLRVRQTTVVGAKGVQQRECECEYEYE